MPSDRGTLCEQLRDGCQPDTLGQPIEPLPVHRHVIPVLLITEVFGAEVAEAVALWWEKLPEEMLGRVSPRALEEAVRKVVPGAGVESLNIVV